MTRDLIYINPRDRDRDRNRDKLQKFLQSLARSPARLHEQKTRLRIPHPTSLLIRPSHAQQLRHHPLPTYHIASKPVSQQPRQNEPRSLPGPLPRRQRHAPGRRLHKRRPSLRRLHLRRLQRARPDEAQRPDSVQGMWTSRAVQGANETHGPVPGAINCGDANFSLSRWSRGYNRRFTGCFGYP